MRVKLGSSSLSPSSSSPLLSLLPWSPTTPTTTNQNIPSRRSPAFLSISVVSLGIIFVSLSKLLFFIVATTSPTDAEGLRTLSSSASTSSSSSSSSSVNNNMQLPQGMKMDDSSENTIKYVEVPSGRDDVTRYKAVQLLPLTTTNSKTQQQQQQPISIRSWMELVSSNTPNGKRAASELTATIANSPYDSLLFEARGTSWEESQTDSFEFALVRQPALKRFAEGNPDRGSFAEHFHECLSGYTNEDGEDDIGGDVIRPTCCSFGNLGGDARLVAPLPPSSSSPNEAPAASNTSNKNSIDNNDAIYSHIAIFMRHAPKHQIAEFWKMGATQYLQVMKQKHEKGSSSSTSNSPSGKTWFSTNGMGVAWLHLRLDSWPKYYSYDPFRGQ